MPDSKRFLRPEAVQRISRLELRARHIVEGFLAGMHRSPYFGQSVEFLQHREYAMGDDLRHVDWKVWARQDRLYVKQYEEDTNLRCTLLVDVSASMSYGEQEQNKYEYACTAAACLAHLILRQQDAVASVAFDAGIRARTPQRSRQNHLRVILESLAASEPREKTDMYQVLHEVAETYPQRGMMILISDCLADAPGLIRGLKEFRRRGHDVLALHVMHSDELDFPFSGPLRFEGLETPEFLTCNPRALREGYLAALQEYLDEVRTNCAKHSVDYALVRTSQPLEHVLTQFLSARLATRRKR